MARMVHDAIMADSGMPTWQLVLAAAELLFAATGEFRLQDLVAEVQRLDPAKGRGTIQPVAQGMTVNAGTGPPSPCGKPLLRTGHGWYALADSTTRLVARQSVNQSLVTVLPAAAPRRGRASRDAAVATRVAAVITTFAECVAAYDRLVPFRRIGQYETHRVAIEARRRLGSVGAALEDDEFLVLLYETLRR